MDLEARLHSSTRQAIQPTGPNVRVIDGAKKAGNLDIFIVPAGYPPAGQSSPISPGGVYPRRRTPNGAYVYYPLPLPGSYTVSAYPEGHDTGTPVFSTTLTVANTDVYTLVLVDAASGRRHSDGASDPRQLVSHAIGCSPHWEHPFFCRASLLKAWRIIHA